MQTIIRMPRLGYFPLKVNTCALSCLVAVAGFFGKAFPKENTDMLLDEIKERGSLDVEKLSEYLQPLEITAEMKENATIADIEKALQECVPCAVTFQIRHKDSPPDSPFSKNHIAVVLGISNKHIILADTSFRRGQVPRKVLLTDFQRDWWASDSSDFWGHAISEEEKIHRKILHLFHSASPLPEKMVGKCIWHDIPKVDRQFQLIERGEQAIWDYENEQDRVDLRLFLIDETEKTNSSS